MPGSESEHLVAALLCEYRVCGARPAGPRARVAGDRSQWGNSANKMAQSLEDAARDDDCQHGKGHVARSQPAIHRNLSWYQADVPGVARARAPEPATMGTPSLCRTARGRRAARESGECGDRLHAGLWGDRKSTRLNSSHVE